MTKSNSGTPRARAFGAELRGHRTKRQVGLRELARKLGMSHNMLIRYEAGDKVPKLEDIASILTALGVIDPERARVLDLARDAEVPLWGAQIPGVREQLAALIEFERTAHQITAVSPLLIPGPLQTADYARALLRVSVPASEVETKVLMRMGRRDALLRRNPVGLCVIIGEWALREPMGDPPIMSDQLWHLVDMSRRENITIQVLPARLGRWTPVLQGSFMLLEFPAAASIVHLEHIRQSAFLYDEDDVAVYRDAAASLRQAALSPAASVELISRLAEEEESG